MTLTTAIGAEMVTLQWLNEQIDGLKVTKEITFSCV